ncbi:MAG: MBL fold metallo-hydrolase [Alphaproteobacteria bacterium]|nr:MBL fold metallo-hydrolase [Alphaproteobacteria bacterium]
MYFLDVGQGDAAFIVTPNNTKILVDGGLRDRALGFLIWKYRLDQSNTSVTIDDLILSHADADHVRGLIPILNHPRIRIKRILHNGIGTFSSGFNEALGNVTGGILTTLHSTTAELAGLNLTNTFRSWIQSVTTCGAQYQALDASHGTLNVGDPSISIEILGPRREPNGASLKWFGDKSHTINGHSLVFRLTHRFVRTFFSGDLNIDGSNHLLSAPNAALGFNAHIFKSPHHGSHEFHQSLFNAVNPMITVISSGDSPDHGHPRASFLGGVGLAGRGDPPLVFSTEIAATFIDAGDDEAVAGASTDEPTTLGDLDFATAHANTVARQRFKKLLPGIINVRTDGVNIYAARRVNAGYQWESYGPIDPVD